MILAIGIGWRYAPPAAREKLLGFIGVADRARSVDPAQVARDIKEKIMPEDPVARRSALVAALKEKMREIKDNTADETKAEQSPASADAGAGRIPEASIGKTVDEAAALVNQLEQVNHDASVGGQIVQRVLERILPAAQCKEP